MPGFAVPRDGYRRAGSGGAFAAQRIDNPLVGLKYFDHVDLPMRRTKARPASSSATQASNDGAHSSKARTVVAKVYAAWPKSPPPIHPSLAWRASSTLSRAARTTTPSALKENVAATFRVRSLGPHSTPTAVVALDTGGRSCYAMRQRPRGCRWPRRPEDGRGRAHAKSAAPACSARPSVGAPAQSRPPVGSRRSPASRQASWDR